MRASLAIALLAAGGCNLLLGVHGLAGDAGGGSDDGASGDGNGPDGSTATCNPTKDLGPSQPIAELDDGVSNTFVTDIDAPGNAIYLASDRNGGMLQLYVAKRDDPSKPFGSLAPLQPTPDGQSSWITVAPDAMTAITASDRNTNPNLFAVTRTGPVEYDNGNGLGIDTAGIDDTPRLTRDGHTLYFASDRGGARRDLYTSVGPPFTSAQRLDGSGIATPDNDSAPALTEDELVMYFTRGDTANGNRDVYVVTRTSRGALFQNPVPTAGDINSSHEEIVGAVSPDGCTLYFTRIEGTPPRAHPFVATKPGR